MFKKFGDFSINESKTVISDYMEKRQKAIFDIAEECAREIISFMQEKGRELLDYKTYENEPYNGQIHMLFAGISDKHVNSFINFRYLAKGSLMEPFFWEKDTLETHITDILVTDTKHIHFFNSIEKDYQKRKNYSWDILKTDYVTYKN